ncbi:hypothetical protein FOL47_006175 [Perkinsus chesapeaki]|uniref:Uncharacterized protein n=1 Tax=Perkinsus chesapeaki TaxID=330153 RepID=A0A7J6LTE7_PERCH|nr:hypothetical protein FOL47_006175 [Perkinsus chesapeaki]
MSFALIFLIVVALDLVESGTLHTNAQGVTSVAADEDCVLEQLEPHITATITPCEKLGISKIQVTDYVKPTASWRIDFAHEEVFVSVDDEESGAHVWYAGTKESKAEDMQKLREFSIANDLGKTLFQTLKSNSLKEFDDDETRKAKCMVIAEELSIDRKPGIEWMRDFFRRKQDELIKTMAKLREGKIDKKEVSGTADKLSKSKPPEPPMSYERYYKRNKGELEGKWASSSEDDEGSIRSFGGDIRDTDPQTVTHYANGKCVIKQDSPRILATFTPNNNMGISAVNAHDEESSQETLIDFSGEKVIASIGYVGSPSIWSYMGKPEDKSQDIQHLAEFDITKLLSKDTLTSLNAYAFTFRDGAQQRLAKCTLITKALIKEGKGISWITEFFANKKDELIRKIKELNEKTELKTPKKSSLKRKKSVEGGARKKRQT